MRVTNIEPGLCESEFSLVRFGGDQARYDATYAGAEPIHVEGTPGAPGSFVAWLA